MAKILLKKVYRCDPYKNEEYAVIDWRTGKPILLPEFNMIEEDE